MKGIGPIVKSGSFGFASENAVSLDYKPHVLVRPRAILRHEILPITLSDELSGQGLLQPFPVVRLPVCIEMLTVALGKSRVVDEGSRPLLDDLALGDGIDTIAASRMINILVWLPATHAAA